MIYSDSKERMKCFEFALKHDLERQDILNFIEVNEEITICDLLLFLKDIGEFQKLKLKLEEELNP